MLRAQTGGDVDGETLARGILAVGFDGSSIENAPLEALQSFAPGAIVLFGRNVGEPDALRALIAALRTCGAPPPLIAIDQEGGRVARIRAGVAQLPAAMAVGATGDAALAFALATVLGRDLARLGISVNFAPVADVASAAFGGAIGTRSYGDDPACVAAFATSAARGFARGGVAPALKHFPGHGAATGDSHHVLPHVIDTQDVVRARDVLPFAQAIAAGVAPIVMTAHVIVDAFDAQLPATLSPRVLTTLLRDELGFAGVIVTDCLEMEAIASTSGTVAGAVAALAAGADLLLVSHRLDLARDVVAAIVAAVADGRIPLARLRDAHARVLRLRTAYATLAPCEDALDDDLPRAAARRAITVVRGDVRLHTDKPVTVVSFQDARPDSAGASGRAERDDADVSLSAALRQRGRKSEHMRVAREPDADDVTLLLDHIARLGDREFVLVTRNACVSTSQRAAVARILDAAPDAIVVAAALPYDAALWPAAHRVACTYGDDVFAIDGCADLLTGRLPATGRLPVALVENAAVR